MASTFKFELVSPERLVLSAQAVQVDVPGTEGRFGILAGHAPYMSTVNPGVLAITQDGGTVAKYFVRGGFADANGAGLTILAEKALPLAEFKEEVYASELRHAESEVAQARSEDAKAAAELKVSQVKALHALVV